jgi:hypothetical protein
MAKKSKYSSFVRKPFAIFFQDRMKAMKKSRGCTTDKMQKIAAEWQSMKAGKPALRRSSRLKKN